MKVERKVTNLCRILKSGEDIPLEHQYQVLTNMVLSYGGRIHGSQFQMFIPGQYKEHNAIAVYFEIPRESMEEFTSEEAGL